MVRIKICGVTTPAAIDAAIAARADYVGFNFHPPSPRFLSPSDAAALAKRVQGRAVTVGVFVDADDATIAEAVASGRLDAIQLHGSETPARAAQGMATTSCCGKSCLRRTAKFPGRTTE